MASPTIFISYRRSDTAGWAGRLHADLLSRLGPDAKIFMDVDGIPPGEDFKRYIDRSVGACDAVIALIGKHWEGLMPDGTRRLDQPDDFVRLEVGSALKRDIRVVPVMVEEARLPDAGDLPPELRALHDRQFVEVDNASWTPTLDRLVASFEERTPKLEASPLSLDFGTLPSNGPWPRQSVQIWNSGGGDLRPTAVSPQSWIMVRTRDDVIDVLVDTSREGAYRGEIRINSAGGRATVNVTATVVSKPHAPEQPNPPSPDPDPPNPTPTGGPPTHMVAAIVTTVLCITTVLFIPIGIVAIVFASRVNALTAAGDMKNAARASKNARLWIILGSVGVVLWWTFVLLS